MKKNFITIFLFSIIYTYTIQPVHNSTLNMTHILFEWEQVPGASDYTITIYDESSGEYLVENVESLIYINKSFFNWNNSYTWYVSPNYLDGTLGPVIEDLNGNSYKTFSIGNSRSNATSTGSYQGNEITIFASFLDNYSAAIDKNGNEIWHTSDNNLVFYNTDYYGQLFGAQYNNNLVHNLPVVEFDINSNIVWQEPNEHFSHHEMIQLPNGNYMSIIEDIRPGPIPSDLPNNLSLLFQFIGYNADGETNEFPWVGDKIIEWDHEGNEVWSWSTFDHFSKLDYDVIAGTWTAAYNDGRFDWTHANAFWFSEEDNAIYFSSRHLSRITKIDYLTGEIIWNMGLEMPSGEVDCGQDLGFSFQHSIIELDNGNIVTLDNGNISTVINDTPYPTTRGLEIAVNELNESCEATIEWSFNLPEELFGFASGNVQKLNNGNYLITTVGDGGTSIEVTPNNEIVWQASYNLTFPNGAVYRANRLPGLYPVAYSIIIDDMYLNNNNNMTVDDELNFTLFNNGSKNEIFFISALNENVQVDSEESIHLSIPLQSTDEIIQFDIIPIHREDLTKNFLIYVGETNSILGCTDINACNYNPNATDNDNSCEYIIDCLGDCGGDAYVDDCGVCDGNNLNDLGCGCFEPAPFDCGDGSTGCNLADCEIIPGECPNNFTYLESSEIPNSTIVLDGSQCFSSIDLDILEDIIELNNLEEQNPIELGTQNWFNGHITRLTIGNFYDGGNVTLTSLPNSIGDFPSLAILYLNYNELTYLPDSITNLPNLIYLVLSFNQLTHLPENIGDLSNMIWLDLGYNSIEYLPESIGNLSMLQYLWIFNNQLTTIPNSICNLNLDWNALDNNFLPYFGTGGNILCGDLPDCIANSQNLNTSIDPLYYSFLITVEQDCDADDCAQNDISGDGIINVIDIVSLVNFILSEGSVNNENLCLYDLTEDDTINVIDIVFLVNLILEY